MTQIVHIEIPADDTAASQAFWGSLFGWKFESFPGPSEYHMTRISEQGGAAITNMEPGKRGTRAYFSVDEINAGAARVRELGGELGSLRPGRTYALIADFYRTPGEAVTGSVTFPGKNEVATDAPAALESGAGLPINCGL